MNFDEEESCPLSIGKLPMPNKTLHNWNGPSPKRLGVNPVPRINIDSKDLDF